ncbi:TPA: hypothetical protein ACH3X2_004628 [Trebouxia sp. C0005]
MVLHGGCQCRKVRYTVDFDEATSTKNFCHCRMCQLATGSPVAAFFHVQEADVKFEGTLGVYQSSDKAVRKFCTNCGTPLVFQFVADAEKVAASINGLYLPQLAGTGKVQVLLSLLVQASFRFVCRSWTSIQQPWMS